MRVHVRKGGTQADLVCSIPQDEGSTLQLLKDHQSTEQSVETYAEKVGSLSQQCQHLLEVAHPERFGMSYVFSQCFTLGQMVTNIFCPFIKVSRS